MSAPVARLSPHTSTMSLAARIPVLMYHRVGQARNRWERRLCVPPELFAAQMNRLRQEGFVAVSIDDFVQWSVGRRRLPARSVLITFDDGFRDVYDHAVPVLDALGWPAAMFLVTARTGGIDEWDEEQRAGLAAHALLSRDQIRQMRAQRWSFHSHSRTHRKLTGLDDTELNDETAGAARDLASLGTAQPQYFCYPYGDQDQRVVDAVRRAGYQAGFVTKPGFAARGGDVFRVGRIEVFGSDTPGLLVHKIAHGAHGSRLIEKLAYSLWQGAGRLLVARVCSRLLWRLSSPAQGA